MNYKFKPLKNLHLYFMWIFYTFIVSFFDIGCILVSLDGFNIEYFIVCIIIIRFFKTHIGLCIRATGDNEAMVSSSSIIYYK